MSLAAASLLLGQAVSGGAAPPIQTTPLPIPRAPRAAVAAPTPEPTRLQLCLQAVAEDPPSAIAAAEEWLKVSKGAATAEPNECLGEAYTSLNRPVEAEIAYLAARDAVPASDYSRRASYGALAAIAMIDQGDAARADATFAQAVADAQATGDAKFAANLVIGRARAQVALGQLEAAAVSLAQGRRDSPDNAAGWLLSATLARRQERLGEAQQFIQRAAELAPREPAIGLEAGVIAVLSGRDEAARRSWKSVIAVAPGTDWAATAQGYLDQLGPEPAPAALDGR